MQDITEKKFSPVYFLTGEEPFFIEKITEALKMHVVKEPSKAFDQIIKYGKDTSIDEVFAVAKRYPMMGEQQLVLVKEAQVLSRQLDKLIPYLERPVSTTVLALAYHGTLDKRKKVSKLLTSVGVCFESKPLYQNQVAQWVQQQSEVLSISLETGVAEFIAEHIGTNLMLIDKELSKLKISLKDESKVTLDRVATLLGIHRAYNVFEFRKALAMKDQPQLFKMADYFIKNEKKVPFLMLLGSLYSFFSALQRYQTMVGEPSTLIAKELGVNPYFLNEYVQAAKYYPLKKLSNVMEGLVELDAKAKGVGVGKMSQADLIKDLLIKIL